MGSPSRIQRTVLLALLTFLAFCLFIFRLDHQSLWYDEGFSQYLARMSLGEITARTARDIHPPFYYYLLHFWMPMFGNGEFSLRFLSLIFGVLTVPLIYVSGRRFLGYASGVLAAALIAISPLFLWYSQEARMYTLVTFLCLLSTYLLLRIMGKQGRPDLLWGAYGLTSVVAVYTHFYAFFVLAFQAIFLVSWWVLWTRGRVRQRWPTLVSGLLCQSAVVAAYLPWSGFVWQRYGADVSYWKGTLRVTEVLRKTLITFSTGHSVLEAIAQPIALGYLMILATAVAVLILRAVRRWTPAREEPAVGAPMVQRWPWLTLSGLLLYLGLPCLLLLVISFQRAKFHPRYLMLASPAYFLLIAGGIASLFALARRSVARRRLAAVVAGSLLLSYVALTSAYAVFNAYFDINFLKDDFRSAVRFIEKNKGDNEVVILTSGHFFPVFTYYYDQDDWYPIPDEPTLSAEHVLDYSLADELNRVLAGRDGAWVLLWQHDVVDPVGFLTMMLGREGTLVPYRGGFWGLKLLHYVFPSDVHFSSEPEIEHPVEVNFDDEVRLLGYTVPEGKATTGQVEVVLYWQALQELEEDLKVSLRIRDQAGHEWGGYDGRPASLLYPAFRWVPGEKLFGVVVVVPLTGTPPGVYDLHASVYSDVNLVGLDILDVQGTPTGTTASLGAVELLRGARATLAEMEPSHSLQEDLGQGLELVGYDLSTDSAQPGDKVVPGLYWHAQRALADDYVFLLQLYDENGELIDEGLGGPEVIDWHASASSGVGGYAYHPANRYYPTSAWRNGEVILGQYDYRVPLHASAGEAELRVSLLRCREGLVLTSRAWSAAAYDQGETLITLHPPSGDEGEALICRGLQELDPITLSAFRVEGTERVFAPPEVQHRVDVGNLGDKVSLYGYDLSTSVVRPGETLYLDLYWQALDMMDTSYTVFTHLLDGDSQIRGQMDSLPVGGARPTTGWVPSEYLRDEYQLVVDAGASPGEYSLEVGMYDAATPDFRRLLLLDAEGNVLDNRIVLDTVIRVEAR
ncbi:MAG: hypothetical protein GTO63_16510 [Anaerolineae bacterium]|nr:hypothetical protein [Anaerolineae bacterium]NIN96416.1 hypothetical protein [Anaerolineae bacterium]NIQ79452.1 hypothetical protein [Anaerolineae bacterium]